MKVIIPTILLIVLCVGITQIYADETKEIPSWVKGVANFWVEDKINDAEFIEALEFLIKSEIIVIEGYGKIENNTNVEPSPIPSIELTVQTYKKSHNIGDILKISGTTNNESLETITILVIDPLGNIKSISQVLPNDGKYRSYMKISNIFEETGNYIIRVQQGYEKTETTFLIS